jgi:hypothetical protein
MTAAGFVVLMATVLVGASRVCECTATQAECREQYRNLLHRFSFSLMEAEV